ncbi:unnamed protein product [Ilex paraguariensis]|uniref:Uncharacterized protein n=1 Tax=Ilex paraguariensis TaxID=185542 RepID=A0ABC8S607_9AQUA
MGINIMTRDQVLVISTLENYRQAWDGTPIDKSDKRARLAPVIPESPLIQLVPRGGMHAVLVTGNDNSETKIVLGDSRRSFVPSSSTLPPAQPSLLCNMQLASLELMGNIPSADLHRSSTLSYADRARNTLHGLMAICPLSFCSRLPLKLFHLADCIILLYRLLPTLVPLPLRTNILRHL